MLQNKVSKMIILTVVILLFSLLFSSCGKNSTSSEVTPGLNSIGGFYYKAQMSGTNDIEFSLGASNKSPIPNNWVHFSLLLGDGTIVNDSARTDANGKAVCQYRFDGTLGHAEIQALVRNVDTTTVTVRANTLIPGTTGQGQYILMEDRYADIKNFNGNPVRIDVDPVSWILYAVYESTLGVVFVMEDINQDSILVDTANVLGVIVNTVYKGKTKDSLGIGSNMGEVGTVYGGTAEVFDPTPPPAYYYKYPALGITFWTDTTNNFVDREVFEIHLTENITLPPPTVKKDNESPVNSTETSFKRYGK